MFVYACMHAYAHLLIYFWPMKHPLLLHLVITMPLLLVAPDLSGVDSTVTCRDKHVINAWEYLKNVGNLSDWPCPFSRIYSTV